MLLELGINGAVVEVLPGEGAGRIFQTWKCLAQRHVKAFQGGSVSGGK